MSDETRGDARPPGEEPGGAPRRLRAAASRSPSARRRARPRSRWARAIDPQVEQRKTRLWLPFLMPVGAILAVAFVHAEHLTGVHRRVGGEHDFAVADRRSGSRSRSSSARRSSPRSRASGPRRSIARHGRRAGSSCCSPARSCSAPASRRPRRPPASSSRRARRSTRSRSTRCRTLSFQAKKFDVPEGINLIKYVDKGGTHTLVFDDNAQPGLPAGGPGGQRSAEGRAEAGSTVLDLLHDPRPPGRGHGGGHRRRAAAGEPEAGARHRDPDRDHRRRAATTATSAAPPDETRRRSRARRVLSVKPLGHVGSVARRRARSRCWPRAAASDAGGAAVQGADGPGGRHAQRRVGQRLLQADRARLAPRASWRSRSRTSRAAPTTS